MSKESSSEQLPGCTASAKERRKCPVFTPSHTECNGCGYWINKVAEIPFLTRGGENGEDAKKWRKIRHTYITSEGRTILGGDD